MSETTSIEWTDSTWNPLRGKAGKWHCSKVSPGCHNCYAERLNIRFGGPAYKRGADAFRLDEKALAGPLRWKKGRRVFVCSMTDLFHEDVPDEFIVRVFGVMWQCPQHTFQVLTKRAARMARLLRDETFRSSVWIWVSQNTEGDPGMDFFFTGAGVAEPPWPLLNVWLGVSVEDQQRADERIPALLQTPAAVRFLSCEPLLGLVDLKTLYPHPEQPGLSSSPLCGKYVHGGRYPSVDWVIVGGESGPGARPCQVDWVRAIVEQCRAAKVPAFVKQLGAVATIDDFDPVKWRRSFSVPVVVGNGRASLKLADRKGGDPEEWPPDLRVRQFPEVAC